MDGLFGNLSEESVVVMNSEIYELFKQIINQTASTKEDPIAFIAMYRNVEIIIDEEVPDDITEVWYRKSYEEFKRESGY